MFKLVRLSRDVLNFELEVLRRTIFRSRVARENVYIMPVYKSVGASRFRPVEWIKKAGYAPQVFVFRNLESGQVLYSQLPNFTVTQIDKQFPRPNWANKKPSTRRDIWKCMCVVNMPNYESGVKLYQNLVRLRELRDVVNAKDNDGLRKKNEDGNVWFSGQYRPTFTQETVADLIESLSKVDVALSQQGAPRDITIHWEDLWRMGDKDKYWVPVLPNIKHLTINRLGNTSREESAILSELGERAKEEFAKLNNTAATEPQSS